MKGPHTLRVGAEADVNTLASPGRMNGEVVGTARRGNRVCSGGMRYVNRLRLLIVVVMAALFGAALPNGTGRFPFVLQSEFSSGNGNPPQHIGGNPGGDPGP